MNERIGYIGLGVMGRTAAHFTHRVYGMAHPLLTINHGGCATARPSAE